jgi:tetratricopeptide (TPR) repeat protein
VTHTLPPASTASAPQQGGVDAPPAPHPSREARRRLGLRRLGWLRSVATAGCLFAAWLGSPGPQGPGWTWVPVASADPEQSLTEARAQLQSVRAALPSISQTIAAAGAAQRSAGQRLADAAILLTSRDYERAIQVLHGVIEKFPADARSVADARYHLGEAYFRSGQLLAARRAFKDVADHGAEAEYAGFAGRAVARLVDITLRLDDAAKLDEVFTLLTKLPSTGAMASSLHYAKAKALLAKNDYAGARASLALVEATSDFHHQAQYLLGVIAVKEAAVPKAGSGTARYAPALDAFAKVTQLGVDTPERRKVVDLAWMAIGRLHYENDQFAQAIQAYNRIDRSSAEFGNMLYELAWVYVRMGDADRALRALEVFTLSAPDNQDFAKGSLLRADLMLRAGMFKKSLGVYESVRNTYEPIQAKVESFLQSSSDPAVYYERLTTTSVETLDNSAVLPRLAVDWATSEEDGPRSFAIMEDVRSCRELLRQSNEIIERLSVVLASPNRVRAFPDLKAGMEKATGLINNISVSRLLLGQGLDATDNSDLSGEIATWRTTRRGLEARLKLLPVSESDFQIRDDQATRQWNSASQGIQRLELQVETMQATVNGLRRVLREAPQSGVVRDPASVAQFEAELARNEADLVAYRTQLDQLRKQVQNGKLQVGFGDQRFVDDENVRRKYAEALTREVQLAAGGAAGPTLAAYATRIIPTLGDAVATEAAVDRSLKEIDTELQRRTAELKGVIAKETTAVVEYSLKLEELDRDARVLVGEVAMRNFGKVRDRLKLLVLQADVGIAEEAWEVREEQRTRVQLLKNERGREQRLLNEELNEVLQDGSGEDAPAGEQPKEDK